MQVFGSQSAAKPVICEVADIRECVCDVRKVVEPIIRVGRCVCGGAVMFDDLNQVTSCVVGEIFRLAVLIGDGGIPRAV